MKVPYDNDPRPLQPANKNLKAVPEECGPNPTQDGPHRGTAKVSGARLPDTSGPLYRYLRKGR